jgi:23S rRNA (uracil1939-C5)-methyltransferase
MQDLLEIEIEKLSFGGDGVGRHDGLVYFVPFSAPGDRLKIRVTEKKKNFARAEIIEILTPGSSRVQPPCPVFGRCGGCTWQHVSYAEQLRQKQAIVEDQLKRVLMHRTQILPIIPSPNEYRYRNRIQLKFDGQNLGFYARQSHDVINIQDCPITEEALAQQIQPLQVKLMKDKTRSIPKVELLLTPAGKVETVFEDSPFEGVGFSQVNTAQNQNLTSTVMEWMKGRAAPVVYDLYAGSGNFSFPFLNLFPKSTVIGVELNDKSVRLAQQQIKTLNLSPNRMRFYLSDVELFLKRNILQPDSLVLLDPPRNGCSESVLRALGNQKLQRIYYISCNPSALARDLERLKDWGHWRPVRVQPFDMFPQTDHVETLVELANEAEIDSL